MALLSTVLSKGLSKPEYIDIGTKRMAWFVGTTVTAQGAQTVHFTTDGAISDTTNEIFSSVDHVGLTCYQTDTGGGNDMTFEVTSSNSVSALLYAIQMAGTFSATPHLLVIGTPA